MNEFTLRQLEYFLAAVDAGSVTAAAEATHISQAAMSMALGQLEQSVGIDLLIRRPSKGVTTTRAGAALAEHARSLFALTAEMEEAVTGSWYEMRGELDVGCMSSLSSRLIPPLVDHYAKTYPQVSVAYNEGNAEQLQEAVAEGRLDVAFIYSLQEAEGVETEPITDVHHHLMLAADHPLAAEEAVSFREVADEYAIILNMPPTIERVSAIIRSAGVEPKIRWPSVTMETVRALVANGLGYSVINEVPGAHAPTGDGVVYMPIADPLPANSVIAALPPGVRPPRRVQEAMHFLQGYFARTP